VNDNEPHTVLFRIANPDRDAWRILSEMRAYWRRTGYLPRLDRTPHGIFVAAPQDVATQWIVAFGFRGDA
jgi:hypothetical protein